MNRDATAPKRNKEERRNPSPSRPSASLEERHAPDRLKCAVQHSAAPRTLACTMSPRLHGAQAPEMPRAEEMRAAAAGLQAEAR